MCLRFLHKMSWRRAVGVCFTVTVAVLWGSFFLLLDKDPREAGWYRKPALCQTPQQMMVDMIVLTFEVTRILTDHHTPHVLCYGTLWGALRNGKILPWDNNVDFCISYTETYRLHDPLVREAFSAKGLEIVYNGRHGFYKVVYNSGVGYINIFQKEQNGEMRAAGWKYKYLWFLQDKPLSFPERLMEPPFPMVRFYNHDFPVPHEDIEILKYLYPSDWWLEIRPPGCE